MTAREWLAAVDALGIRVSVSERHGVRLRYREWASLPVALVAFAAAHEKAIVTALRPDATVLSPLSAKSVPTLYVRGARVTEDDVRTCLGLLGKDVLKRYDGGEMPKADAYEMTAEWLGHYYELARKTCCLEENVNG